MTLHDRDAVRTIENCWCCYRDRQMFQLLKYAICTADHSLTYDIMRKINPAEAQLFDDPVFQAKIRFRFAGEEFPPYIVFKVFIKTDGKGIKYLNGKKAIRPASKAAVDSLNLMGNRKFLDQMISDLCEENQNKINDELDISNLKDYMKYVSTLDERSVRSGGKGNTWRTLSLDAVPRHCIIHDVLTFLRDGQKTDKLLQHMEARRFFPPSQQQQVEIINALYNKKYLHKDNEPSRRSKQTKKRVEKMRKLYQSPEEVVMKTDEDRMEGGADILDHERRRRLVDVDFNDNSWDEEGKLLFEWTQNLSDDNVFSK